MDEEWFVICNRMVWYVLLLRLSFFLVMWIWVRSGLCVILVFLVCVDVIWCDVEMMFI